jgi:hypothetical protein
MLDAIVHLRDAVLAVTLGMAGLEAVDHTRREPPAPAQDQRDHPAPPMAPAGSTDPKPIAAGKSKCDSPRDTPLIGAVLALKEIATKGMALLPRD